MDRTTYYTLRTDNGAGAYTVDGNIMQYDSFEDAYRSLVFLYNMARDKGEEPTLWGIWRTTVRSGNEMTAPCWAA